MNPTKEKEVSKPKKEKYTEPKVILPFSKDSEYYVENLGNLAPKNWYRFCKRVFDILASLFGLILLAVPMLVIAITIKCVSKGTILYRQDRLGINGKPIMIVKFRTMIMDAEKKGIQWSNGKNDSRIYPFGRFLRNTRLDELPQLWCILKGDMSFVGPRPERECFYNEFETYIHGFSERLKVKPGLTGLAQINGGYHLKPEEKILYDVEYMKKRSFWLDIKIIFKTFSVVFGQKGAK